MTWTASAARAAVLGLALALAPLTGSTRAAAQDAGPGAGAAMAAAADSLLAEGRPQEAAWALREAGDTARADTVLARLRAILRDRPEAARPLGMDSQGVSYTFRLDHGQRVASIFKVDGSDVFCPECGADREVGAYRVDWVLGFDLTPMTVFTRIVKENGDTVAGSAMYFVNGAGDPADRGVTKPDALRLFDAIIGNSDRHSGNWLLLDDRVVAIDHNRAFEYQPSTRPETCWETEVDSIAEPAALGAPWGRYRSLPPDSVRAAMDGVDTALVRRFLEMRPRVVARVEARIARPDSIPPHTDCTPRP